MKSPTNQEPLKKEPTDIKEPKKKKNFLTSTFDELKLCLLYTSDAADE